MSHHDTHSCLLDDYCCYEANVQSDSRTIYVPDNFTKIQEAVDAANSGDTVYVRAATYFEHVIVKKNFIKLAGENKNNTLVDGNGTGTVFQVEADNVEVTGFTVNNSITGIYLHNASTCTLSENNVSNCKFGIWLLLSSNCCIRNNNSTNNEYNIRLDSSTQNNLTRNTMQGNSYNLGILGSSLAHFIQNIDETNTVNAKPVYYLVNRENLSVDPTNYPDPGYIGIVNSSFIKVENLNLSRNVQGVLFAYTSHSTIENVTAVGNKIGFALYYSSNCTTSNDTGVYNMYQGILLWGSSQCNAYGNNLTMNTEGITLTYSSDCSICGNTLVYNDLGIELDHATDVLFFHNNMINNVRQATLLDSSSNTFDNGLEGNFWSDHLLKDSDLDGICDTQYTVDNSTPDRHALMGSYTSFNINDSSNIDIISNFTITNLEFDSENNSITFNLTTGGAARGFCRIAIPKSLIDKPYVMLLCNNTELLMNNTILENETHYWLYFNFSGSSYATIVPELNSIAILLMLAPISTIIATLYLKKPHPNMHD